MNTVLWIWQIFIAVVLVPIGGATVFGLLQKASAKRGQPMTVPDGILRFVGAAELAGAVGVVVPWATGVAPWLTPLAALGLVPIMVGASVINLRRGTPGPLVLSSLILVSAVLVAWGRWEVLR